MHPKPAIPVGTRFRMSELGAAPLPASCQKDGRRHRRQSKPPYHSRAVRRKRNSDSLASELRRANRARAEGEQLNEPRSRRRLRPVFVSLLAEIEYRARSAEGMACARTCDGHLR